ncbi:MAG: class I SAM-dependent RNA methyltransferase [Mangrovibacterium sp.]
MTDNMILVATTYAGLEEVLAGELVALGADEIQVLRRAVCFRGGMEMVLRTNYALRTALRVLMPLKSFRVFRVDDLYHQASKIHWEDHFSAKQTFAVQSTVFSSMFSNSMFASLKLKDAIVDRFRRVSGRRPSVDVKKPDVLINLHLSADSCTVSLDSSGESLHKRGYRSGNHEAPLSEVLAAGLLKLSGWTAKEPLADPMCGSGTVAIEAAMMAAQVMPGELGRNYAFMNWKNYNPDLFEQVKRNFSNCDPEVVIYGSDLLRRNIRLTAVSAERAGVAELLRLQVADFRSLIQKSDCSFLLFNPPYGERLIPGDDAFYAMLGERLKHGFTGSEAWIISTPACFRNIGLRPARKIPLYNGSIPCSFRKFELYRGSRKKKSAAAVPS